MIDNHQLKAVELRDCSALLLAGPGCGKTHILARRVFHANTVYGVPFGEMLCLTFTNRAAREMARRVHDYLGSSPQGLFIGNIHSFCFRFLHANRLISPDTSVIDEEDVRAYLASSFGMETQAEIKEFLDKAAYVYQLENDHPDSVIRRPKSYPSESDYERIESYIRFKENNRLVDYDDILRMTYTALLGTGADTMAMTGFTWLQVDEVQDMTPLQLAIIDAVCVHGRRTALYLGDEQQAIFGFLGAGGRALDIVKEQCGSRILRLQRNYRSPDYLVSVCNRIAMQHLGISADFLPKAVCSHEAYRPLLTWTGDANTLLLMAASRARRLLAEYPDENVAILVHTNLQGQAMADMLAAHGMEFFHVSRPDMFHQAALKTIMAHLAVIQRPTRHQEWARLLYQTRSVKTLAGARQLMNLLRESAMAGNELLAIDSPTAIERFAGAYEDAERTIVVLDTETTGLDVFRDDVIQIAAIKIRGGAEVPGGRFCAYIRTDRTIPHFLANGTVNPMKEAYAQAELLEAPDALRAFAGFVGDNAILAGHNLAFDAAILRYNYTRYCPECTPAALGEDAKNIDTLLVARLLIPALVSHRLETLIDVLNLDGVNSHNAIDDVAATVALMSALLPMARRQLQRQAKIRDNTNVRRATARFASAYGDFHAAWTNRTLQPGGSLTEALAEARRYFSNERYIGEIRHFTYFLEMIDRLVVDKDTEPDLKTQLENHFAELNSFNESDLLANGIVDERLSVMTVHKAKGLEMDNVILLDASSHPASATDYARLLYVAFSRARRRLCVGRSPWGANSMLDDILKGFEVLPPDRIAAEAREESSRRL